MTFADYLIAAQNTNDAAELYDIVNAAGKKLDRNIGAMQMLSYTPGAAADASHYADKCMEWRLVYLEICAIFARVASELPADELVAIVSKGA